MTAATRVRGFLLALALFPLALAAQEVSHLAAYSFFGVPSSLLVTPWRFHFFDVWLFGLHAAAGRTPTVPVHVAADVLGPLLPTLPLTLLWLGLRRTAPAAAIAVLGNVLALTFFGAIELVFALGAFAYGHVFDILLWPELNYGPVLAIMAALALLWNRRRRPRLTE